MQRGLARSYLVGLVGPAKTCQAHIFMVQFLVYGNTCFRTLDKKENEKMDYDQYVVETNDGMKEMFLCDDCVKLLLNQGADVFPWDASTRGACENCGKGSQDDQ